MIDLDPSLQLLTAQLTNPSEQQQYQEQLKQEIQQQHQQMRQKRSLNADSSHSSLPSSNEIRDMLKRDRQVFHLCLFFRSHWLSIKPNCQHWELKKISKLLLFLFVKLIINIIFWKSSKKEKNSAKKLMLNRKGNDV